LLERVGAIGLPPSLRVLRERKACGRDAGLLTDRPHGMKPGGGGVAGGVMEAVSLRKWKHAVHLHRKPIFEK
jgi:hypothetical protein